MLIHFTHARKISKADKPAAPHQVKPSSEYIASFERMNIQGQAVKELYAELCEFMHPAGASVGWMFMGTDDGLGGKIDLHSDKHVIEGLHARHRPAFHELLMAAFNPVLLTLRVLDHFGQFPRADVLRHVNFSEIPLWRKIEAALTATA
jgi:hypothetical protein